MVSDIDLESLLIKISQDKSLNEIKYMPYSAWLSHAPFMKFLIRSLNPNVFVELGTYLGFSYFVACNEIYCNNLVTKAFAIDNWIGDPHAGGLDESAYESVMSINKEFERFSTLIRRNFNEAAGLFREKVIDLLHIDGYHSYEAVSNDFKTWLPKMNDNGIILIHDIHIRRDDFGVYKFWKEIKKQFPTFELTGGFGLGCIFLNQDSLNGELALLTSCTPNQKDLIRGVFDTHSAILFDREIFDSREVRRIKMENLQITQEK